MACAEMGRQARWAEAPEMASKQDAGPAGEPRRAGMLRDLSDDSELDVESSSREIQLLLPRPGEPRAYARRSGLAPAAAMVVLLGCAAALGLGAASPPSARRDLARQVILALGPLSASGSTALSQQALEGQGFVYVADASSIEIGDAIVLDPGTDEEEIHRVEQLHPQTGCIRTYHGMMNMHIEGAPISVMAYTPELQAQHDLQPFRSETRFSREMSFGANADDTMVRLSQGCYQFEVGDEVEMSSRKAGNYELNMVTGITFDEDRTTCFLHLAYPVAYAHAADASPLPEISKMVGEDEVGVLNPTPAPMVADITTAPSAAPTASPATQAPATAPPNATKGAIPKDITGLDTNKDGRISLKEAWAGDVEMAARFSDADKDGDKSLSPHEFSGYATLDSDGDGVLCRAEAAGSGYVKGKFRAWDADGDGALSREELRKAAMGDPQIVFVIKHISYDGFSADSTLFEAKREQLEGLIAGHLDGVEEGEVAVRLSAGSVRVDAYIAGDTSQVEESKSAITAEVSELFNSDPAMADYLEGARAAQVASITPTKRDENRGPGMLVMAGMAACFLAMTGIAILYLGPCDHKGGGGGGVKLRSKWVENPPDAIVVPGGGLTKDGTLVPWVQHRLLKAKQIYDDAKEAKRLAAAQRGDDQQSEGGDSAGRSTSSRHGRRSSVTIVTMCEGIRYGPRDPRGNRTLRLESELSAEFLKSLGVDADDIVTDDLSLDTMGNAYFLRTTHTDVSFARKLVIVTSEFHMARTKMIFDKTFDLGPFPEGTPEYELDYEQVPNESIQPSALRKRKEWERQQLQELEKNSKQWKDLHDVHSHLFAAQDAAQGPTKDPAR